MKHKIRSFALAVCVIFASPAYSLEIILKDIAVGGSSAEAIAGFEAAAARWESIFTDDVTVRIDFAFESLAPGVLGSASSQQYGFDYSSARAAMVADGTSAFDVIATGSLQAGPDIDFLYYNPNEGGTQLIDETTGLNLWNTFMRVNSANLKALGVLGDDGVTADATIRFSSDFDFDFDPSDGITDNDGNGLLDFDFIGVATHEIGHALGFVSGVDLIDINTGTACLDSFGILCPFTTDQFADAFPFFSLLDLFKYSDYSAGLGVMDFTFGNEGDVFFSLDGGLTNAGGTFSTGFFNGDGYQASHWEDDLFIGIMDPTAGRGELLSISDLDRLAFDVIGWDLVGATRVPEPGTLSLLLLGLGGLLIRRRVQKV